MSSYIIMPGPFKLRKVPKKDLYWVIDATGKHYSKEGLPKEKAKQQQKALYAAEARGDFEGAGFFSDIYSKAKTAVQRTFDVVNKGVRKDYPPSSRKMIEELSGGEIVELAVRRDPIQSMLNTALNFITLGKWNEMRTKYAYDKLFHLGLVARVKKNGRTHNVIMEKNEVVNIAPAKKPTSDTEFMPVPLNGRKPSFTEFLKNAEERKGTDYFLYNAFSNNCQDFVMNLLEANDLLTSQVAAFVKQPIEQLVKGLPGYTEAVAKGVTDLGAAVNYVIEGEGLHKLMGGCGLCHLLKGGESPQERAKRIYTKEYMAKAAENAKEEEQVLADGTKIYTKPDGSYRQVNPDGSVYYHDPKLENTSMCYVQGPEGKEYKGRKTPEECKALSDDAFRRWEEKNRPANAKFFRPAVETLVQVGDVAAQLGEKIGGPAAKVAEAYRTFAPPGSAYYEGGGETHKERMKRIYGNRDSETPAQQIKDTGIQSADGSKYYEIPELKGTVMCHTMGPDGKRYYGRKTPEECKILNDIDYFNALAKYQKEKLPALAGLVKAGDFFAKLGENIPGVANVVSEVYKNFAPPGSEYYQYRGGMNDKKVCMDKKEYLKEHKRLIEILKAAGIEGMLQSAEVKDKLAGEGRLRGSPKKAAFVGMLALKKSGATPLANVLSKTEHFLTERKVKMRKGKKAVAAKAAKAKPAATFAYKSEKVELYKPYKKVPVFKNDKHHLDYSAEDDKLDKKKLELADELDKINHGQIPKRFEGYINPDKRNDFIKYFNMVRLDMHKIQMDQRKLFEANHHPSERNPYDSFDDDYSPPKVVPYEKEGSGLSKKKRSASSLLNLLK